MKLLVTIINGREAELVSGFDCDIIDLKNPDEGSLGAPCPEVIDRVCEILPDGSSISIAVGDVPDLPGTVSLAILGALRFKPEYVKVGLMGPGSVPEALNLMRKVVNTAKAYSENTKVVAAGYADYRRTGSISPLQVPEVAYRSGADAAMIDTAVKDGKNLFDHISAEELKSFSGMCREKGLLSALAGSIRGEHLEVLSETGADIVGVRGAVCRGGERSATLDTGLLENLISKHKIIEKKLQESGA